MINLIKNLIQTSIDCIKSNISFFISLIFAHILIMLSAIIGLEWIENNINIYSFTLGPILLRISLFLLILGIWIGYFKLVLNLIDQKNESIFSILKFFYLLPKIFLIRILSYLTLTPIFIFIINKFPYDTVKYGTNIEYYLSDISNNLSTVYTDELSRNLYFAYFNYVDLIILTILAILPILFMIKFWLIEILIIDTECDIKQALYMSFSLTKPIHQFLILGLLISCINLVMILFGFFFFITSLTLSYIIMFNYYRLLLKNKS